MKLYESGQCLKARMCLANTTWHKTWIKKTVQTGPAFAADYPRPSRGHTHTRPTRASYHVTPFVYLESDDREKMELPELEAAESCLLIRDDKASCFPATHPPRWSRLGLVSPLRLYGDGTTLNNSDNVSCPIIGNRTSRLSTGNSK